MLRLADNKDRESILDFLKQEASFNTFLIGDILTYGFDSDMQKVYINEGDIDIVVVVYFTTMLIYQGTTTKYDLSVVFDKHTVKTIMGKESVLSLYEFDGYTKTIKKFMELKKKVAKPTSEYYVATSEEADSLAHFYMQIEEFVRMYHSHEEVKAMISNRITKQEGRHYYYKADDKIIAHVNSAAENPYSAIIGGVGTLKDYRHNGYATNLVKALCYSLQQEGIMPCLFYDNEEAGKIYTHVGFESIGNYMYLNKEAYDE